MDRKIESMNKEEVGDGGWSWGREVGEGRNKASADGWREEER